MVIGTYFLLDLLILKKDSEVTKENKEDSVVGIPFVKKNDYLVSFKGHVYRRLRAV